MSSKFRLTEVLQATNTIQEICNEFRRALEEKVGRSFTNYKAKTFMLKVVNVGEVHYFVKIEVDGSEHIHVRAFECMPWPGEEFTFKLHSFQTGKTAEDELRYF